MRLLPLLALILVCITLAAPAQSISVFNLNSSQFPLIKAKVLTLDSNGQQVQPSASDIVVTEDGIRRNVLSVTCPPPSPSKALSSVLVIDISGSMESGPGGVPNIALAKDAAKAWVRALPLERSECAITSFDSWNYLNQDFTTDRAKLLSAIMYLNPMSGTDYDKGLLLPPAGGLQVTKNAKYKRVIVFLTDGLPNQEPHTTDIITEAVRQNCSIYVVTLGLPCPPSLKAISTQTGGEWFENVTTLAGAIEVYEQILHQAEIDSPCEITWQSDIACAAGQRKLSVMWNQKATQRSYAIPDVAIAKLRLEPSSLILRYKPIGQRFDTTVMIAAINAPFTVTQITSSNPAYDINPKSFSLAIGQARLLTVSYTPTDADNSTVQFDIQSDLCPATLYAYGSYPGLQTKTRTLHLNKPNGAEILVAGSDSLIMWSGIPASDSVTLAYSTDNGSRWHSIAQKATGASYPWHVPMVSSDRCLVRVMQRLSDSVLADHPSLTLKGHTYGVEGVAWSPDGNMIATASEDYSARIWDAVSGSLITTLTGHIGWVESVVWSPDGRRLATSSQDNTARIWDAVSGALIQTLRSHTDRVPCVAWSPDGSRLATASDDGTSKIWDANNGTLQRTLTGHTNRVNGVTWSPDGSLVATASDDNTARIWDATTGVLVKTLTGHTKPVTSIAWSVDEGIIATGSADKTAKIWDAVSGAVLWTLTGHLDEVWGVAWTPDGSRLATASMDYTARIWDANSGVTLKVLQDHTYWVRGVAWSPDASRLATSSRDQTAKIWVVGSGIQIDTSDAVFSIVIPSPVGQDVDMGTVLIATAKDSVVQTFVSNAGTYPFTVKEVQILGADASQFSMVSSFPPFKVPANGSRPVEFRFYPTSTGIKSAQLRVITQADTILKTIHGEGIAPSLAILGDVIDFGQVEIGSHKDTTIAVAIHNIGSTAINFSGVTQLGPDRLQFSVLSGSNSFTLAPGDSRSITLRFAPFFIGRISGRIAFEYVGAGSPAFVDLFGQGIGGLVRVADDSAFVGEHRNIVLRLDKARTPIIMSEAPTKFRSRLSYNATILNPIGGIVQHGVQYDTLNIEGSLGTDGVLARLPFVAMLGDSEVSRTDIVDFEWLDEQGQRAQYDVMTQSGQFHLLGVCQAGGPRLLNPNGQVQVLKIAPNPTSESAELEIETVETGRTCIVVIDMLGREMETVFDGEFAPGRHTLAIRTSELATGQYLVQLRTPTVIRTTRMSIIE